MRIKNLVKITHTIAKKKGFWKHKNCQNDFVKRLMLIVTEISECCEGHRNNDWDNIAEELADATIRIMDLCGGYNIDLEKAILKKIEVNKLRSYKHKKKY